MTTSGALFRHLNCLLYVPDMTVLDAAGKRRGIVASAGRIEPMIALLREETRGFSDL